MRRSEADAKKPAAVADRLRATEDALRAAQTAIAEQEKREKELRKLLVSGGIPEQPQKRVIVTEDMTSGAKLTAIKSAHDQKVRTLLRSINQLQEQIQTLKSQDKEHRRSALIQNLRKSQREQEMLIDILKQTLLDKVPEFQESRELVNEYILKKSVGGPMRFRPKSREELENELEVLDNKYKRAVENLKKAKEARPRPATETDRRNKRQQQPESDEEVEDGSVDVRSRVSIVEKEVVTDPALQEEIDQLKVELASKTMTIHSQVDEINELYAEIERLRVLEEKVERKKEKIAVLEEKVSSMQLEQVSLVHEKESEMEKRLQVEEELQFVRDTRIEDVQTSDNERLRQLELIQSLRARETELQNQLEDQQRKWSSERAAIQQQIRLLEKERLLLDERLQKADDDRAALTKRHDSLFVEHERLKVQLTETNAAKDALIGRIEELEGIVALHESKSHEDREGYVKSMATQIQELKSALVEKDELARKLDRQLNASKLLARQAKKEKEQLQDRLTKLQEELETFTQK
ncbi:hypothetical protein Poli38472_003640 [Pythium oligandrum]|uniref:Uncharacterized protein n=1 Tax=Pythium oligandrum TaxID=41045 RepID=A0A8K1CM85_PYTOL|nr:hypothetical protein Poli38472_003640 [Pythium oligandrum]|eukprot:TMW65875.1 hypothetical protein Poli38472_003640 [Pythium oligandrum]